MAAPNFANIPQELKRRTQWVLWKTITRAGKPTKVPYRPTGTEADSSDPASWSPYEIVVETFNKGGYAGIGYVFDPLDPYTGIDLDDCINPDGSIKPKAKMICDSADSYSEISPSGKGIKIFLKAKNPVKIEKKDGKFQQGFASKKPDLEIEIYYGSRFFTLTGNRLDDYPPTIEDRNSVLTAIFKGLFKDRGYFGDEVRQSEPTARTTIDGRGAVSPEGGKRFAQLLKDDPGFADAFTTAAPVGTRSDVEFNLCARLWEAGIDEADIHIIMNSSPQTKWIERDDNYRYETIRKAVAKSKASHEKTPIGPTVLDALKAMLEHDGEVRTDKESSTWEWRVHKPRMEQAVKAGWMSRQAEGKAHKFLGKYKKNLESWGIAYDNLFPLPPKETKEEFSDKIRAKALSVLKTGDPVRYVVDSCGRTVLGAETAFKKVACCISAQNIRQSAGLHPKLTGASSGGKTYTIYTFANHLPFEAVIKGSMSAKAGFYHSDGNRVFRILDDYQPGNEDLDTVIKQTTSEFHDTYAHRTVANHAAQTLKIGSEQTWAITSVNNDQDIQVLNRGLPINVDDSEETTEKVNKRTVERYGTGEPAKLADEQVLVSRCIFQILRDEGYINVRIPFYDRINWIDKSNRRNPSIFMDLVIAHTALYRFQREQDSEGYYLATEEDFRAAKALFTDDDSEELVKRLTRREREVLEQLVSNPEGVTRSDISEALRIAPQQVSQILGGQKGLGGLMQKVAIKETKLSEMMRINDTQSRTIHKTVYSLKDYDKLAGFDAVVRLELKPQQEASRNRRKEDESKDESKSTNSSKEDESKESKRKREREEKEKRADFSSSVDEESNLSREEKKNTFVTFAMEHDSEKDAFVFTSSAPSPTSDESNEADLTKEDVALLERIKSRLVDMNAEVTPFALALAMRGNDHDIGLERCRAWLEAGA